MLAAEAIVSASENNQAPDVDSIPVIENDIFAVDAFAFEDKMVVDIADAFVL